MSFWNSRSSQCFLLCLWHQWSCQCICACMWSTYSTHMDWYMCMYVNHIQHTYAHSYAQDTAQCISDMHIVHWICTYLYLYVFDCICMYPGSLELYQVHMCMYVVHIHACIHADTYTYALLKGNAYVYVFLSWIHAHVHFWKQCISVCIWLYFEVTYIHICINFVVFIAPNRPPAAARHTRISHHHRHKRLPVIQIPIPDMNELGRRRSGADWGKVVLPTGESIRGAAGLEITIRKSLTIRHCPWKLAKSDRWTTRNLSRTWLPAALRCQKGELVVELLVNCQLLERIAISR